MQDDHLQNRRCGQLFGIGTAVWTGSMELPSTLTLRWLKWWASKQVLCARSLSDSSETITKSTWHASIMASLPQRLLKSLLGFFCKTPRWMIGLATRWSSASPQLWNSTASTCIWPLFVISTSVMASDWGLPTAGISTKSPSSGCSIANGSSFS